jgi:hypothetical protein
LDSGDEVSFFVFPNPVHGNNLKIHSSVNLDNCRIIDQLGRVVKDFNFKSVEGYQTINIEGLSSGVYLMMLSSDIGIITETIKIL